MRKKNLTRLIACMFAMLISIGINAQQVTKVFSNQTLKEVLKEIETQTGLSVIYRTQDVNDNKRINASFNNASLSQVMGKILDSNLKYEVQSNILIIAKQNESINHVLQTVQGKTVRGQVVDTKGEPIIGATVTVKGSSKGTITGYNGNYVLENVSETDVISVSYIGYEPMELPANSRNLAKITLKEDTKLLDEVVVIGYGKTKRSDLSSAVGTIANADKLMERPVANVEQMLQGQIPGVTIVSNGGHPDAKPTITIRGMGSRSGESPLYVVDGVPGAPFNFSDIESMTVLKDAASAAIYGAYAGSAGVILITTKQAAKGKPALEYNVVTGVSVASNLPQSLTIEEERMVRAKALGGEQFLPDGWDVKKNPYIGQNRTDWIDAIFRTAPFQRHNVALTGGTEEFQNRLSVEYLDRQGTLLNTFNKEVTARLNSMFKLTDNIRIREDFSWQNTELRGTNTRSAESGVILSALMMPRNAEVYNADGSFGGTAPADPAYIAKYGSNFADIHGDVINPVRELTAKFNENNRSKLTTSTFLDIIEPIKGLNFTSRFTYKLNNYFLKQFTPRRLEPGKPDTRNNLQYATSRSTGWDLENTLTYDRIFGQHNIGLMASTTATEFRYREFGVIGRNFDNEAIPLVYFGQAGSFDPATDGFLLDRNFSAVARASYSYANRYFLTGSWRRDYAGRLPKGQKYGDFPSVTAAWKISSEPFMPKSDVLNLLKLRASWGRVGNLGSIDMGYGQPLLSNFIIGSGDVGGQVGFDTPIVIGKYMEAGWNPLLTWETSEQLDFGLDATLFNNRLNIIADYFQKRTLDLIKQQDAGWASNIGLKPMLINEGEIRNSGVELGISWRDKIGKNTEYWISGNLATLKNVVHNIGAADEKGNKPVWTDGGKFKDLSPFRSEEGQPLYSFYLIKNEGVFKTQQEIDSYVNKDGKKIQPKAQVGDLKFIDENGDGKITNADRVFMGNAMPKLTYALSGGFSWKDFSFNMMLQGVSGVKLFNGLKFMTLNESVSNFNRSREILDALNGPSNKVPRISNKDENDNFPTLSSYYLENGDYLRIKNITLGYSLTRFLQNSTYFANRKSALDVTFSIDNLATFTSYSGIDPEVGRSDLNSAAPGLDGGQYPVSRTFSVGLRLKF